MSVFVEEPKNNLTAEQVAEDKENATIMWGAVAVILLIGVLLTIIF